MRTTRTPGAPSFWSRLPLPTRIVSIRFPTIERALRSVYPGAAPRSPSRRMPIRNGRFAVWDRGRAHHHADGARHPLARLPRRHSGRAVDVDAAGLGGGAAPIHGRRRDGHRADHHVRRPPAGVAHLGCAGPGRARCARRHGAGTLRSNAKGCPATRPSATGRSAASCGSSESFRAGISRSVASGWPANVA